MDDMILAGALSILTLYLGVMLIIAAGIFVLAEMYRAAIAGDCGRAVILLTVLFLIVGAYTGAGLWIQKTGRI